MRVIKFISINITVLIVLLLALEFILRSIGIETIHKENSSIRNLPGNSHFCKKRQVRKLIVYDSFFTDNEGIFKAKPSFYQEGYLRNLKVNKDGFRGNVLRQINNKITVLLLGDSFTWGVDARPISNCFADLIQNEGYHVYNTGIPGTGIVQYKKIAQKYIRVLKPDAVCVMLFMGNDVRESPHPTEANKNLYYITNFGWLRGYNDRGCYFNNANEALDYYIKIRCGEYKSIIDLFLYRTIVGKIIYKTLQGMLYFRVSNNGEWETVALNRIREECMKYKSRFFLFLIPVVKRNETDCNSIKNNIYKFEGLNYYYPRNLKEEDYQPSPFFHFNNKGHKKFASFVIKVLKKNGLIL